MEDLTESRVVGSIGQLAKALNVAKGTVSGWRKNGMPVMPDGRFDIEQVREWHSQRLEKYYEGYLPRENVITSSEFERDQGEVLRQDIANDLTLQRYIKREALTRAKIREKSDPQLATWYDQLRKDAKDKFEMMRLAEGESTENVSLLVASLKDLKKRRREQKQLEGGNGGGAARE